MQRKTCGTLAAAAGLLAAGAAAASDAPGGASGLFEAPVRIKSGGEYINVDVGHAAPYVYDFDGDGVNDLLVGQFGQGRLRIYRNVGTNAEPRYDGFEYFKTGHEFGTVPAG